MHRDRPFVLRLDGHEYTVDYEPAESTNALFGGNSNWRGPVWFPVNYLLIESIQKLHYYYGDQFTVQCPTRSGREMNLWGVSVDLSQRLSSLFLRQTSSTSLIRPRKRARTGGVPKPVSPRAVGAEKEQDCEKARRDAWFP